MWKTTAEGPNLPARPVARAAVFVAEVTDSLDNSFFAATIVRLSVSGSSFVGFGWARQSDVVWGEEGEDGGDGK